jgi:hypothetical protein
MDDITKTFEIPEIDLARLNPAEYSAELSEEYDTTGAQETATGEKVKKPRSRSTTTRTQQFYRRFLSEREMEQTLPWEFEPGAAYHVISGGDVDSLSFLKHVLRQQPLEYLALSTWCMALQDIEELDRYMGLARIKRMDSYVGEIFKGSYRNEYRQLCDLHKRRGGRVAIFRNHSKIFCGFGERFDFVIESSANINTNPRTENTVITLDTGLALFYKAFFDGIVSFERNFDAWTPYGISKKEVG